MVVLLPWAHFGGPWNGKWYILWPLGIFYGHLVYFMTIMNILWLFGKFYGHLVYFMAIMNILWLFVKFCGPLVLITDSRRNKIKLSF
jgi:hypothetical protein